MRKIKDQKGSITLFVLMSCLFFVIFLMGVFTLSAAKRQAQIEATRETEKIYSAGNQEEIYKGYFGEKEVSIYTKDQLFEIGKGNNISITEENGKMYMFNADSIYVIRNDIEFEYNGIWELPAFTGTGRLEGSKIKIKDTSKQETIYYYYSSLNNYKYPHTKEGYSYKGLMAHYDGINNTGSGHSFAATTWKDLSGNKNNGTLKNFEGKVKQAYGATWLKVFYHNAKNGIVYFANEAEALNSNTTDKYSVLGTVGSYKKANGEFEFLLEYPGISGYNRWAQTSNPCTTIESVTGYRGINISWTGEYWGGLCKSSASTGTFIDGSVNHGNWFYAIGAYTNYNGGMPGPDASVVQEAYLWVRVDDLPKEKVKQAYGTTWLNVFYHNAKNGTVYFASEAEAWGVNTNDKYSILGTLGNYKKANGEFEFLLEYPGISGYNRWAQTSNPCTTAQDIVIGYRGISLSWTNTGWGGLSKTGNAWSTFLDGQPGPDYWYAIGEYYNYANGFPGPNGTVVQEAYLWVRIDEPDSGWADNSLKFDGVDDNVLMVLLKYPNITLETVASYNRIKPGDSTDYDSLVCSFEQRRMFIR